ncbi:MAG TPA: cyclic nucleotide-binding domain-containing protein [Thermodesulfobacteriota bacterium]|nr:cyclic nucleotide-binding domain-containing protein [Thermodesulfobacteriota bacterium]
MAQIELTQDEMKTLQEILQRHLAELLPEIAFTHRKDYIQFLKKRKEFIENFIRRLEREQSSGRREAISPDRLRGVDFLQGLEDGELQSLSQFFEEESVAEGVMLCEEGARAERLFILEEGRVSIRSKTGRQYSIDAPGKMVGWSFLVPPFLYTASAVTTAPSRLLVIKSPDFYYALHKEPRMGMKVINNLAQVVASRLT